MQISAFTVWLSEVELRIKVGDDECETLCARWPWLSWIVLAVFERMMDRCVSCVWRCESGNSRHASGLGWWWWWWWWWWDDTREGLCEVNPVKGQEAWGTLTAQITIPI